MYFPSFCSLGDRSHYSRKPGFEFIILLPQPARQYLSYGCCFLLGLA